MAQGKGLTPVALGLAYLTLKDDQHAVAWFRQAAMYNNPLTETNLAATYHFGQGVTKK